MKRKFLPKALTLLILISIVFFALPIAKDIIGIPISDVYEQTSVTIPDGTSTLGIGNILKESNLIRSEYAFLMRVKLSKFNGKPGSGTYTLSKDMPMIDIIEILSQPKEVLETVTVTIPEGYSAEQIAYTLEKNGVTDAEGFLKALSDNYDFKFINHIPSGKYRYKLQGFLFPSTYEFYKNSTAHAAIEKMLSAFESVYESTGGSYEDIFDIITIASLVEKEAKLESERPTISGVISNRTRIGMAYQIDASVLYAATDGLFNNDKSSFIADSIKNLDSPYNTYMYAGLPAGPICNPGITSIKAALNPEEHKYLYYHTDTSKNDGSHIFSSDFDSHLNSIN